MNLIMHLY